MKFEKQGDAFFVLRDSDDYIGDIWKSGNHYLFSAPTSTTFELDDLLSISDKVNILNLQIELDDAKDRDRHDKS